MGSDDIFIGPYRFDGGQGGSLVGRVGISVDEDDGDRLDPAGAQGSCRLGDFGRVDLGVLGAVGSGSFGYFEAQIARHHRAELPPQAPGLWPVAAPHLKHVAEAGGGYDAGSRALFLKQRVGRHRGAVDYCGDGREIADCRADAVKKAG